MTFSVSTVGVNEEPNSAGLSLRGAYPNPAGNFVELPFSLDRAAETRIDVFNALGEKMATVQQGMTAPGLHAVVVNTQNFAPGAYYYTFGAGTAKMTRMFSVIR